MATLVGNVPTVIVFLIVLSARLTIETELLFRFTTTARVASWFSSIANGPLPMGNRIDWASRDETPASHTKLAITNSFFILTSSRILIPIQPGQGLKSSIKNRKSQNVLPTENLKPDRFWTPYWL